MKRGFTLLEMLIVLGIIAALVGVVIANLSSSRATARDEQRVLDLDRLKGALDLYYAENRAYPSTSSTWQDTLSNGANYIPNLAPTYINPIPLDPSSGGACPSSSYQNLYTYWYKSDGKSYKIIACAEKPVSSGNALYDAQRPGLGFMVCSGQPACTW